MTNPRPVLGLARGEVLVLPYQAQWPGLFQAEAQRLRSLVGVTLENVDHIGSTALVGMPAKPILDLMATFASPEEARQAIPLLEQGGYELRAHDTISGRLFLVRGGADWRTHHLSLVARNSDYRREHLALIHYLRQHDEAFANYRDLKLALASRHPQDRGAYTNGKDSLLASLLQKALSALQT